MKGNNKIDDPYNLKAALNRIRPLDSIQHIRYKTNQYGSTNVTKENRSSSFDPNIDENTNANPSNENRIFKEFSDLKDKFECHKENNTKEIIFNFEKLDGKIETIKENYLTKEVFLWAVAVLIVIASLIGSLSYYPMIIDTKESVNFIRDINKDLEFNKEKQTELNSKLNSLENSIKTIEKKK